MPSQTHFNKAQRLVKRFKEEYNCNYVTTEYTIRLHTRLHDKINNHHYRLDVFGKDIYGNIFWGEVGHIDVDKKRVLTAIDTRKSNITFIHEPYTTKELAEVKQSKNNKSLNKIVAVKSLPEIIDIPSRDSVFKLYPVDQRVIDERKRFEKLTKKSYNWDKARIPTNMNSINMCMK